MTEHEIEEAAKDVLEAHEQRVPVDVLGIATAEDINVVPGEFDECFDGRIEYYLESGVERFYLFYAQERAPERPAGRVRFSIAHELGHYYLPHHRTRLMGGEWHASHANFFSRELHEHEADLFAACLLMPRDEFTNYFGDRRRSGRSLADLSRIAESFQTSLTSTAIRYTQLDLQPCAVVVSESGYVRYAIVSPSMKAVGLRWIRPGLPVPAGSATARLLDARTGAGRSAADGSIDAAKWFDGGEGTPLWEDALVFGRTGRGLSLLSSTAAPRRRP